jgi:hypothetical protein
MWSDHNSVSLNDQALRMTTLTKRLSRSMRRMEKTADHGAGKGNRKRQVLQHQTR